MVRVLTLPDGLVTTGAAGATVSELGTGVGVEAGVGVGVGVGFAAVTFN